MTRHSWLMIHTSQQYLQCGWFVMWESYRYRKRRRFLGQRAKTGGVEAGLSSRQQVWLRVPGRTYQDFDDFAWISVRAQYGALGSHRTIVESRKDQKVSRG